MHTKTQSSPHQAMTFNWLQHPTRASRASRRLFDTKKRAAESSSLYCSRWQLSGCLCICICTASETASGSLEVLLSQLSCKFHQTPHRNSRGTLGDPWLVVFHPGGACDIQMYPGSVFGKLFQERRCRTCAAPASASVHQVRNARLGHFKIFICNGQSPHFLAGLFDRRFEPVVELVVIRKHADVGIAQRHYNRAGQSRSVNQMCAAELSGIAQSICEHEPSFRIGVDDLNCFSVN